MKKGYIILIIIFSILVLIGAGYIYDNSQHKNDFSKYDEIEEIINSHFNEYCDQIDNLVPQNNQYICPTCKRQEIDYSIENIEKQKYEVKGTFRVYYNFPNRVNTYNFTMNFDKNLNIEGEFPELSCMY